MHPPHVRAAALALIEQGLNDCEVSRRLGIPRPTIRDWRRPTYVPLDPAIPRNPCPRCWRPAKAMRFTDEDYAELLAVYLGDGCISASARTSRLRISLDAKYPGIIADTTALLSRCFPHNPVGEVGAHGGRMVNVSLYCSHLPCLFPQHGPGMKHERPIVLESWQQNIVDAAPWLFIRGCIRTDGCCFINRTGAYEYRSYDFTNMSKDIVNLFVRACDGVGVFTRTTGGGSRKWSVRINRRRVAKMVEQVGLKK
jgi:Homeodomain-like domain